jgi:hypothetical protein
MQQQQSRVGNVGYPKQQQMFGGGSTPSSPPTPAPPMRAVSMEVNAAKKGQAMDAAKRRGAAASLLAGETMAGGSQIDKKTLLG